MPSLPCQPLKKTEVVEHLVEEFGAAAFPRSGTTVLLRPALPDWLDAIEVVNLRVDDAWIDLRVAHDGVRIVAQRGDLLDIRVA